MATVQLKSVEKAYAGHKVIHGVDLEIRDREFMVFVGPSGCGKSTLLRMIAGLEEITGGDLLIDGTRANDVSPDRRGLAMVFQSYALYPHMTVADNMGFALKLAKVPEAERNAKVAAAAKILKLEDYLDRKPKALSGGQRQRVAIGRAIVRAPKVFLFDEPLSNLDAALRVQMRIELARLHKELDATMIYVTHDQVEAMTLADRIVVLNAGKIEQVGRPLELYERPRNLFVAGFLGSPKMNFVETAVQSADATGVTVGLPGGHSIKIAAKPARVAKGDRVTLGVRAEHLVVDPAGALVGRADVVEHLGGEVLAYVDIGGSMVVAKLPGHDRIVVGDPVSLAIRDGGAILFDAKGEAMPALGA
ncbi:ABC transporter ATP-binding protein [Methylobrevis albus]|uniref:Sn-glycerol-3-phosphate ABC transporter ATP-binding protein UgpC n=1 Tax=Methylobrevis albus TaxID=2793297 RepID=A0A931MZT8_9HYPH|nr:sn-glycerol-3-phosphate ABC transporter ATP-binding protein UgpC [Methylobrevis albus]MBH0238091.1 sn-glycerol-3-phosphate ABC transporter ATP-binding protein UgpC [Methylobrevis albus]